MGDVPVAVRQVEGPTLPGPAEQGSDLARWVAQARAQSVDAAGQAATRQRLVLVTGGKGGVGKSNFSLNFSLALAERGRRVLLVDCDSGLGNLDVLLGLCTDRHLGDVVGGRCTVEDALITVPGGVRLLPAASGMEAIGRATATDIGRLVRALSRLTVTFDFCVLDSGAGLGPQIRALLRSAGEIVVVTTPEPTALADAYATIKTIHRDNARAETRLVINMADSVRDAEAAMRSVAAVCRRFLEWTPGYLGAIPRDPGVLTAVRQQRPFLLSAPGGPAARALRRLTATFCDEGGASWGPRAVGLRDVLLSLLRPRIVGDDSPRGSSDGTGMFDAGECATSAALLHRPRGGATF